LFIVPTKRRKGRPSTIQEEEEASSLDTLNGSRSDMKIPSSIYNTRITTDAPAEVSNFTFMCLIGLNGTFVHIFFIIFAIVISQRLDQRNETS